MKKMIYGIVAATALAWGTIGIWLYRSTDVRVNKRDLRQRIENSFKLVLHQEGSFIKVHMDYSAITAAQDMYISRIETVSIDGNVYSTAGITRQHIAANGTEDSDLLPSSFTGRETSTGRLSIAYYYNVCMGRIPENEPQFEKVLFSGVIISKPIRFSLDGGDERTDDKRDRDRESPRGDPLPHH